MDQEALYDPSYAYLSDGYLVEHDYSYGVGF